MLNDIDEVIHVATVSVADADTSRLFTAYRSIMNIGQIPTGEVDPITDEPVMRDYTDAEVWMVFCRGILDGVIANIHNEEKAAAERAVAAVTPIEYTAI